jgi:hypothetical protein
MRRGANHVPGGHDYPGVIAVRIVSYRIVSYRIVSYRIVSYRIVSYRIVSNASCFLFVLGTSGS